MSWNDVYKQNIWEDRKNAPEINIINSLINNNDEKVLDVGCGYGRVAIPLFKQGINLTCVDCVADPLEVVREKSNGKIVTVQCESSKLPFEDDSFDGIIAINSIYHNTYAGLRDSISEMYRVLKIGGWLFCTLLSINDSKYGKGEEVGNNVFISLTGPDIGIPHVYVDENILIEVYKEWKNLCYDEKLELYGDAISAHYIITARK